ncbi:Uncharacterized protein DAT39_004335 [Clarias magur]|uniref:Uncharacterized protein n=1 Tax=Clarias magur TaxID=1594786 RepID=A0A8J4UTV4_CLAMG|nr:Uncharacterized protein DAT39_004335 [Clarias magur]
MRHRRVMQEHELHSGGESLSLCLCLCSSVRTETLHNHTRFLSDDTMMEKHGKVFKFPHELQAGPYRVDSIYRLYVL